MSNALAISAVTATMRYLLDLEGIVVTTKSPDILPPTTDNPSINIFLYQVTPNLGYRNQDFPARDYSGELVKKQQLGIDLHYLLTAYNDKGDEVISQKTLADAMRILHENSVLTRATITDAISHPSISDPPDLDTADLADQVEMIKINMQNLSLEDLTKIWSSFFKQGPYRISVGYKATVVLLDGKKQPRTTMPVQNINSYVEPLDYPEIFYIQPQILEWKAGGMEIKIVGRNLKADIVKIDFGQGLEPQDMPDPKSKSPDELVVTIPDTFVPGIMRVRVVHPLMMGTPPSLHSGLESNVGFFAVAPVITQITPSSVAKGGKLTVTFAPIITQKQDAQVIIRTYKPLQAEWPGGNPASSDTIQVTIPNDDNYETNNDLPVRFQVDGIESQVDQTGTKWNNEFKRPVVKIT